MKRQVEATWQKITGHSAKTGVTTPPDDFPAAVAGCLLNGRVRTRHVASFFFDLAQRGFITIAQEQEDLIFHRLKKSDNHLSLSEQLILRDLFTDYQNVIPFYHLPPRLNQMMQATESFLKKETKEAKTTIKQDHKQQWRQFEHYLSQKPQCDQPQQFGQYFAYSVAFGLEVDWALRFTDSFKAALPIWYNTPYSEQHLGELVRLAQTVTRLLANRAPAYQIVAEPGAFAIIPPAR